MKGNAQREHYEKYAEAYTRHYFDKWSMKYRRDFIYKYLWQGKDLNLARVLELACGSGYNSKEFKKDFPKASLTGLDISPTACENYRKENLAPAFEGDITKPLNFDLHPFDAAFVIGGLHHCIADLDVTLRNMASLTKPGGYFMVLEPNKKFFLEPIRNFWYKIDPSFDEKNEAALDHDELYQKAKEWFDVESVTYLGGPAFFFVLNSMIMRVPLPAKPYISPPLIALERMWNHLPLVSLKNVFAAVWRRNHRPVF